MKAYFQMIKPIVLYAGLLLTGSSFSSAAMAVGGTPAYQVEAASFQWIDASTVASTTSTPIGFDFQFYGVTRTSLMISEYGYLNFAADWSTYNNIISPLRSSEFYPSLNQRVYTLADGVAPNRRFTVSWINVAYRTYVDADCGCSPDPFGGVSFQATLYEGSNDIVFRYLDTIANDEGPYQQPVDNGKVAWVGVTYPDGGTVYSDNQAIIFSSTALRFFMGSPGNLSPIANAGVDQVVNEGTSVTLNGNGSSDSDGTITYSWLQPYVYPTQPQVTLDNPNAAVSGFVAPQLTTESPPTSLPFQLTVIDDKRAYTIDTTKVDVIDLNARPTVSVGPDITVNTGAPVTLTANASDPNGTIAQYIWFQDTGRGLSWTGSGTSVIRFTAPTTEDVLRFIVIVVDNEGASASDGIVITVRAAPAANAGADQTAKQKTTVTLDGSASTGNIASYRWRQVAGKSVTLKNATSAKATFSAPSTTQPMTLTFELTVKDANGVTATDQVIVTVTSR